VVAVMLAEALLSDTVCNMFEWMFIQALPPLHTNDAGVLRLTRET
jgi:hypothetical protein